MMVEIYFEEIVKLILAMTFTGSILSIFLFAIKPFVKNKLPKSFQYYMWFPVIIALLLPLSEIVVIPVHDRSAMSMKSTYDIVQQISDNVFEMPVKFVSAFQNMNRQNHKQAADFPYITTLLFMIWLTGMILNLVFHSISYLLYVRRLKRYHVNANQQETALLHKLSTCKKTPQLYKNPMVTTPILLGVFRPTIILPDRKYEDINLHSILMHEITHMKKHDIAVKWLLIFAGALHWFNPIIYLVHREINRSCELACDESVIKKFDNEEIQQYGDTLIAVAADSIKKIPVPITMFENKKNLKERLGAIMKYKKYSRKTVVLASVILGIIVCGVFSLSSLSGTGKDDDEWMMNNLDPAHQKRYKAIKLEEALRTFEKKNIVDAHVYLGEPEEDITNATILIVCQEKNPSSEMKSEIRTLVSEKLALDEQDIRIDYMDVETFTSPDLQEIYLD